MAIEAGDRPVPGAGSQLGWLLWADALEDGARDAAAERLCAPDILTDYGLRTLSSDSPVFDPHHYHRGSVWPFDSWLGWGGLRAAGRHAEAERVRSGVLAALDQLGRSPELYAVARGERSNRLPLSNRVQAWTVGARWAFENDWDGLTPALTTSSCSPRPGGHGDLEAAVGRARVPVDPAPVEPHASSPSRRAAACARSAAA